ncbi:MAG TPA: preprotein translocase subunit YajC [Actinomycetota bacterium]|nr:preprotein translocase subunit YajC [Actinomycetota bacterium]
MIAFLQVLAASGGSSTTNTANPLVTLLPLLGIGAVFYFILIRPQQRQRRAQQELTRSVEVGDEVLTSSGIFGRVVEVDDEAVVLEVAPDTRLRFVRGAIARKLTVEEEEEEEQDEDQEAGGSS